MKSGSVFYAHDCIDFQATFFLFFIALAKSYVACRFIYNLGFIGNSAGKSPLNALRLPLAQGDA